MYFELEYAGHCGRARNRDDRSRAFLDQNKIIWELCHETRSPSFSNRNVSQAGKAVCLAVVPHGNETGLIGRGVQPLFYFHEVCWQKRLRQRCGGGQKLPTPYCLYRIPLCLLRLPWSRWYFLARLSIFPRLKRGRFEKKRLLTTVEKK